MTTCPGSPVPGPRRSHLHCLPQQGRAGPSGTRPWAPLRDTPLDTPLGHAPGPPGHAPGPPKGHAAGPQRTGARRPPRAGSPGRRLPGPGRSSLTCRRRSCRRSPRCSAETASCCGPHACLHGEEKHAQQRHGSGRGDHTRRAGPPIRPTDVTQDPLSPLCKFGGRICTPRHKPRELCSQTGQSPRVLGARRGRHAAHRGPSGPGWRAAARGRGATSRCSRLPPARPWEPR